MACGKPRRPAPPSNTLGRVLRGRTLAIWGYGKIGRLVAGYGRAFGMTVLVWGSEAACRAALQDGHQAASTRQEFFEQADVLTLHLRLLEATRAIVTEDDLARMKPDALFVNTSRAELVESGALEAALVLGRPGCAALDVFDSEPLAPQSALLRMANVLATPHLGYVEKDSYELIFRAALQNVADFFDGAALELKNPAYRDHVRTAQIKTAQVKAESRSD